MAFVLRPDQATVLCLWVLPARSSRPCRPGNGAGREEAGANAGGCPGAQRRVWEPLKPYLEGATTVFVSPDGLLTHFRWHAARPGPGTYLVEDLAIGYVSSRSDWWRRSPRRERPNPRAPGPARWPDGHRRHRLPGRPGARHRTHRHRPRPARGRLPARSSMHWPAPGRKCRVSPRAFRRGVPPAARDGLDRHGTTEGAVKQRLGPRWWYLHVATHGFFESPARVAAIWAGLKSDRFGLADMRSSEESASLALAPLLHWA